MAGALIIPGTQCLIYHSLAYGQELHALREAGRCPHAQRRHYFVATTAANTSVQQTSTKNPARDRRPENTPGDFFVDHTCIDCDTCRWMAPETFTRLGSQSAVYNQPASPDQRLAALQALVSCPTASIRTEQPPSDILDVHATFPIPIDKDSLPGVYACGYHSKKSFGAVPYFITRPDGNILIDSPEYTERLAKRLEELGGVRYMFLTHMDDVADHATWQKRFKCDRVLHEEDVRPSTADVEIKLAGSGPWSLGPGIDLVHTPGHTKGCVCLLYKPGRALFTGDHFAKSSIGPGFTMFRRYSKLSVDLQFESVKALLPLDFIWILPGHARRIMFNSVEEKNFAIEEFLSKEGYLSS